MVNQEMFREAAQCLTGISDEWNYSDIYEHLGWLLDNPDEIAEGYPLEVMTTEFRNYILEEVINILAEEVY